MIPIVESVVAMSCAENSSIFLWILLIFVGCCHFHTHVMHWVHLFFVLQALNQHAALTTRDVLIDKYNQPDHTQLLQENVTHGTKSEIDIPQENEESTE